MNFIESFYAQIMKVFSDGVFGISLGDIAIIFISIILSLLIRGAVANILVNKVKKIVSKTGNKIDDKLFEIFNKNRDYIKNKGPITIQECPMLYYQSDALFLPTLLGSFPIAITVWFITYYSSKYFIEKRYNEKKNKIRS